MQLKLREDKKMSTGELIDVVLAFTIPEEDRVAAFGVGDRPEREGGEEEQSSERDMQRRVFFENKLANEGLVLEREVSEDGNVFFVKIHAPFDLLCRLAEQVKLALPIKVGCDFHVKIASYQATLLAAPP
jgi:hypothetical protein